MQWEPKPDSPTARDDEAEHKRFIASCAKDLAVSEWTPPPPPRAPSPPRRSKFVTQRELGRLMERVGRAVREALEPLRQRIGELEQREWVGIWTSGKSYAKNSIVSHDGSAWLAVRQYPEGKPGGANTGWRLIVKRGRDGKDAK
jgi:hypothetical protein